MHWAQLSNNGGVAQTQGRSICYSAFTEVTYLLEEQNRAEFMLGSIDRVSWVDRRNAVAAGENFKVSSSNENSAILSRVWIFVFVVFVVFFFLL